MTENQFDKEFPKYENLATKIFSETVCLKCESKGMPNTDNLGRDKFYEFPTS